MIDALAELTKDNTSQSDVELQIYAHALATYCEAAKNIASNGAICSHPRTGAPMENPYLKIQTQKAAVLLKMAHIDGDRVMDLLMQDS